MNRKTGMASATCALALTALAACHGGSPPPAPVPDAARPAWNLSAAFDSVGVHPGESRNVTFTLRDEAGRPVAGQLLQFAIADDPQTPDNDAQGATLSFDRAVTDVRGEVVLQIIAGLRTTFQVRASAPASDGGAFVLLVFVKAGSYGAVELAPIVSATDQSGATWSGSRVLFFDATPCSRLAALPLPPSLRPQRMLAPGLTARYDAVNTDAVHGALGYGLDEAGVVRFSGCVDVPGSALLENDTMRLPLPLVPVRPRFLASYKTLSQLQFAPPPIGATEIASAWGALAGCPYDPAQLWLDCTIAALDDDPDAGGEPARCTLPARLGSLAAKLVARRGALDATASDGCRAGTDAAARPSLDALAASLFRAEAATALAALTPLSHEAEHLTDIVKLRSTLAISPLPLTSGEAPRFRVDHTVDAVDVAIGTTFATVDTAAYGAPVRLAYASATSRGSDLVVDRHGFALRLGSAARVAFTTKSLQPRTGQSDVASFVRALYALPRTLDAPPATGCVALDRTICADVGEPVGCLQAACTKALARITARLEAGFDALDGSDLDLLLAGPVPLFDQNGDGVVEALGRLGPEPARPGLWTGELRASAGTASFSGIWLGVP